MDESIRTGVTTTEDRLPGGLEVKRRAPGLYKRLQKGFYPTVEVPKAGEGGKGLAKRVGRNNHELPMVPVRATPVFPGIEYLSCMAIAVSILSFQSNSFEMESGERGKCVWRKSGHCSD